MFKRNLQELQPLDISTHEFTLAALGEAFENDEILSKKIKRLKVKSSLRFIVVAGAIYYIYRNFNARLKELEKVPEETK